MLSERDLLQRILDEDMDLTARLSEGDESVSVPMMSGFIDLCAGLGMFIREAQSRKVARSIILYWATARYQKTGQFSLPPLAEPLDVPINWPQQRDTLEDRRMALELQRIVRHLSQTREALFSKLMLSIQNTRSATAALLKTEMEAPAGLAITFATGHVLHLQEGFLKKWRDDYLRWWDRRKWKSSTKVQAQYPSYLDMSADWSDLRQKLTEIADNLEVVFQKPTRASGKARRVGERSE